MKFSAGWIQIVSWEHLNTKGTMTHTGKTLFFYFPIVPLRVSWMGFFKSIGKLPDQLKKTGRLRNKSRDDQLGT
jgi:hypothetical protein